MDLITSTRSAQVVSVQGMQSHYAMPAGRTRESMESLMEDGTPNAFSALVGAPEALRLRRGNIFTDNYNYL